LAFLDHYLTIRRIGSFISNRLNRTMHEIVGRNLPDYEKFAHPFPHHWRWRFTTLTLPMLMMFVLVPIGSLLLAWTGTSPAERDAIFLCGVLAGVVMIFLFIFQGFPIFVRSAKLEAITNIQPEAGPGSTAPSA
jgi:hypothetical protein